MSVRPVPAGTGDIASLLGALVDGEEADPASAVTLDPEQAARLQAYRRQRALLLQVRAGLGDMGSGEFRRDLQRELVRNVLRQRRRTRLRHTAAAIAAALTLTFAAWSLSRPDDADAVTAPPGAGISASLGSAGGTPLEVLTVSGPSNSTAAP